MSITFVTGNKNKLREVQAILDGIVAVENVDIDITEIQGTKEAIVMDKCDKAAQEIAGAVMVEDTSLCFNALNGLPGPYIKWFLQSLGPLALYTLLDGFDDKSAQAVCTIAYRDGRSQKTEIFQGRTEGRIVPSRGPTTFGWDSSFECGGKTYAEMTSAEKNAVSHRAKALHQLRDRLGSHAPASE